MFRSSNFDKSLESATSHLRLEPDWPSILVICDSIRQNDVSPKAALSAIKKKMSAPNPHTAMYSLLVLESVVKNCGSPIHDELCTKENCEMLTNFIESTPHENVKLKMLELIQAWAFAFRTYDKYQAIKDTMTILKTSGHQFPELKEADAMFTSDTAPSWLDGDVCHRCRVEFSFTVRKHHCRNCGQIFCAHCSSKMCTLPKFGIEKEVRVCEACYMSLHAPITNSTRNNDSDLPAEYLTSSLAQQSQAPPRKTEQELKEEEELQLAIALSQSEAEQQKQSVMSYRNYQKSPSPEMPLAQLSLDDNVSDPELAKYLNRDYWESRKTAESPASPSAPSPMTQPQDAIPLKSGPDDLEIDTFSSSMKSQVEIFVNRMKSNSSRGRSNSNDSAVQTLFLNVTSMHSKLLAYIKEMDDKRMWFEQLQDKLTQVKDSRAALDMLRHEHQEKLRRIAEETERQRQMQMAHTLELMRKKKQEYLLYQRQLALRQIQEQEREMQMRQEQQKALYQMGGGNFSYMPGINQTQSSPIHMMGSTNYGYGPIGTSPMTPNVQGGRIPSANPGTPTMHPSSMPIHKMQSGSMPQGPLPPQIGSIPPSQVPSVQHGVIGPRFQNTGPLQQPNQTFTLNSNQQPSQPQIGLGILQQSQIPEGLTIPADIPNPTSQVTNANQVGSTQNIQPIPSMSHIQPMLQQGQPIQQHSVLSI
ncbi:Hepatocyte growth factor-regulated tyrosine kinase substrate, partial [Pseudolycoriella hygida]